VNTDRLLSLLRPDRTAADQTIAERDAEYRRMAVEVERARAAERQRHLHATITTRRRA